MHHVYKLSAHSCTVVTLMTQRKSNIEGGKTGVIIIYLEIKKVVCGGNIPVSKERGGDYNATEY